MLNYSKVLKLSMFPVSGFSIFADACDTWLALNVIINPSKTNIRNLNFDQNTNAANLALDLSLLGVAVVTSIPTGLTVFYHMLKKSRQVLEEHHEEEPEQQVSCGVMRKVVSFMINTLGLMLRTGLTIKSSQDFLKKLIFPYCGPVNEITKQFVLWGTSLPVAFIGTGVGSFFTEVEHTHSNITGQNQNQAPKNKCLITSLTYFVYVTSFISHTLSYFFDFAEMSEDLTNKNKTAQYIVYGLGLLLCGVAAIGDSFFEGDHIKDIGDYVKSFSCKISDGVGLVGSFLNMFAHVIPEFAGLVLFLKALDVADVYCWLVAGFVAGLDMFPQLAVEGRYITYFCRDVAEFLTKQPLDQGYENRLNAIMSRDDQSSVNESSRLMP